MTFPTSLQSKGPALKKMETDTKKKQQHRATTVFCEICLHKVHNLSNHLKSEEHRHNLKRLGLQINKEPIKLVIKRNLSNIRALANACEVTYLPNKQIQHLKEIEKIAHNTRNLLQTAKE